MAFHANTEWDVRTGGNDANGGGFQVGSTGTDRSQSDAAYQAYTDIVIDHTTNTKITSAAHPFDATSVGNIINITAGTGFTVQRVQIVSVASGVATCDKAVGTIDSTGGTGNLGGGLLTIAKAVSLCVTGNAVHIQTGTYTLTASVALPDQKLFFYGYGTAHYDAGTAPLVTTATNSTTLFTLGGSNSTFFTNVRFSNTATIRAAAFVEGGGAYVQELLFFYSCVLDGFSTVASDSSTVRWIHVEMYDCEVKNCTATGVSVGGATIRIFGCYFHDNAGDLYAFNSSTLLEVVNSLIVHGTGIAVRASASNHIRIIGSTLASHTSHLISAGASVILVLVNNIIYGSTGGYGATVTSLAASFIRNNAFGSNSSGDRSVVPVGPGDVALTADPFTSTAGHDYSLNGTAGGGADCKGVGFPGVSPEDPQLAALDIGAVQYAAGAAPDYPSEDDVRDGVAFGEAAEGNLALPAVADVKEGVQYGANGTEFEGTLSGGGGATAHGFAS